jgi:hypothetical protein
MAMHRIICNVIEYAFELPITPFVDNIEYNLEKEIDFKIEACKFYFNCKPILKYVEKTS